MELQPCRKTTLTSPIRSAICSSRRQAGPALSADVLSSRLFKALRATGYQPARRRPAAEASRGWEPSGRRAPGAPRCAQHQSPRLRPLRGEDAGVLMHDNDLCHYPSGSTLTLMRTQKKSRLSAERFVSILEMFWSLSLRAGRRRVLLMQARLHLRSLSPPLACERSTRSQDGGLHC